MKPNHLTEEQANKVYDLLVKEVGANESGRAGFVEYFTTPNEYHEWRFCGMLGFGGKCRLSPFVGLYVSCYREDDTPERLAKIIEVNKLLVEVLKPGEDVVMEFNRIDAIFSVSGMLQAVQNLPSSSQREVILLALSKSQHQFTWSWIAKNCNIPSSEWPVNPYS